MATINSQENPGSHTGCIFYVNWAQARIIHFSSQNLNNDSSWHSYHWLPGTVSMALYVLTHVSWRLSRVIGSPVLRPSYTVEETEAQMETFCLRATVKWMAGSTPYLCPSTISSPLTCNCELRDLGPGNRTRVFNKNSMCSWPLSHVSVLKRSLLG